MKLTAALRSTRRPAMGRHALLAVTSADVAALLPPAREPGTRCFTAVCVAPGGTRFYLGDDEGAVVACRVVRGMANAGGELGASVRVDAVANVVDDDIVNHAPFEDSDDDDDDDGRKLSLRVMQLEYLPSMHALVALTPRRGVTVHHLSRASNADHVRIRSGRVSGTSGAVAFALDASGTHPSCVAVSRAGKKAGEPGHRSVTFREIVRQADEDDEAPSRGVGSNRPRRFKPRAAAVPFGVGDVRLGAAHPALTLTWHGDAAKLVVGNGRWYHLVDVSTGAATDVVPMTSVSQSNARHDDVSRSTFTRPLPTTLAIAEGDGTRAVVCVTGSGFAAVVSPTGEPAGGALRLGSSSSSDVVRDDEEVTYVSAAYSLAFASPYLVAAPVRGSAPAAVFDRAVERERVGEPVQFLSLFDASSGGVDVGASPREQPGGDAPVSGSIDGFDRFDGFDRYVAGEGVNGTLVACSGSSVEVYAKAPVLAQVKGMLSTPGWWAPAARLADAQCEDLQCEDLDVSRDESDAAAASSGSTPAADSPPPWIVAHAEAGFCAARELDFDAACSHWRRAGDDVVRPVEDVARTFLPRLLPRRSPEDERGGAEVSSDVDRSTTSTTRTTSTTSTTSATRRRRFWNLAPPPADLDSVVASAMRAKNAGTTRAARRSVAPISGDVSDRGVAPIAPIDPNVHPITHPDANPRSDAHPKKEPNVGPLAANSGLTFAATLLKAKRALSAYLSAHRTNRGGGFELNTVCLALWAECGECDALERTLASFADAFAAGSDRSGVLKNAKSPPYDAVVVKDACRRNSRWHALAILLDTYGRRPRGERDEEDAVETWRALALGEKTEGGDFIRADVHRGGTSDGGRADYVGADPGADHIGADSGADYIGGAVRRDGARRVGCDFATAALVRMANRRTDDDIRRIAERHAAWIADVDPRRAIELLTDPRVAYCVPLRAALRVLEDSPACGVGEPAEYLRAMMASFGAGGRVRRRSDFDAKDLHTKYALALLNAARDPVASARRDHATELHNFLSATSDWRCDAAVVARAIDPAGLTESDARGDLRGFSPNPVGPARTDPNASDPRDDIRGFESHLVLLRRRLGDHAAAIRLILDVITHEGGVAGAEAAAEKYVERCQSGRANRRRATNRTGGTDPAGESRTGTWRGDGDADVTAALLNAYVRRSHPPRWAQAARVASNPDVRVDVDGALAMLPTGAGVGAEGAEGAALFERAVRRRDAANRAAEAARREAREAAEAEARSG